uniref:Tho1/MOS11 C-terminal domain n=1 Tax=Siphoviridae sp. ct7Qv4 TaxID=2827786 RepID=A0A8S5SMZ2_9CAUD|nr:MAG TPA: Tho1/MOS11 C-terminal domain [Siphoviridae sp. ct7Qv4]
MKKNEEVISLIENGYGFTQMLDAAKISMDELLGLMKQDEILNRKLRKRFGDERFDQEQEEAENGDPDGGEPDNAEAEQPEDGEPEQEEPKQSEAVSEIDALKAEADTLGIQYNPTIGAKKLKARIEEFKNK